MYKYWPMLYDNNFEQCPPIPPHITEYGDDGSHVSSIDASIAVEHILTPKLPPKLSCHWYYLWVILFKTILSMHILEICFLFIKSITTF